MLELFLGLLIGGIVGVGTALAGLQLSGRKHLISAREQAARQREALLAEGQNRAREIELSARQEALEAREAVDAEQRALESQHKSLRRELDERETSLDRRQATLDLRDQTLISREQADAKRQAELAARDQDLSARERELCDSRAELKRQLGAMSSMNEEQARAAYLRQVEDECRLEAGEVIRRSLEAAQDEAREKGRNIVLEAIQRYAAPACADHTVASITIPEETMKGRVIGREGRNIRSFEKATGVDVIIDDTPGVIVISCFDPVRREVGRMSLERLIADGRIHPARIEEIVNQATTEMDEQLSEFGRTAADAAHVPNLPRPLYPVLGRLHFRTSYGQNVLHHSQEVAHLAQVMAAELGLDSALARRAGLLHDIGKAMDHEAEGSHPTIGADFLRKHEESEAVINAAAAHHGGTPATTPYTPLVMAADAISASRPGARRESLERYIKRLHDLEEVAMNFKGVRQAYAIHAGREVRVIVDSRLVDDRDSAKLARDVAKQIKTAMSFPGEIKVTVLREVRTVEYAR